MLLRRFASTCPFRTLGLAPGASADEIRAAFRKRALETHPDVAGSSADANERFVALKRDFERALGTATAPVQRMSHSDARRMASAELRNRSEFVSASFALTAVFIVAGAMSVSILWALAQRRVTLEPSVVVYRPKKRQDSA